MSIKFSDSYHYISVPNGLTVRLINLAMIAAFAEELNLSRLYSQAKAAFDNLREQWVSKAEEEAKSKTKRSFWGGDEIYMVHYPSTWDESYKMAKIYTSKKNIYEKEIELQSLLNDINS